VSLINAVGGNVIRGLRARRRALIACMIEYDDCDTDLDVLSIVERLVNPRFAPGRLPPLKDWGIMSPRNAIWRPGPFGLGGRRRRGRPQRALPGVRVPNAMTIFASGGGQPIESRSEPEGSCGAIAPTQRGCGRMASEGAYLKQLRV
jgi:hypothetical protein